MANYSAVLLLSLLLSAPATSSIAADPSAATTTFLELESMLESVRSHGRTLFTNAIATSDLHYHLLNRSSAAAPPPPYTLFAPTDEALFSLDMASDAAAYVAALHYHVVPGLRVAFAGLQNLSSSPFLDTLLPHYSVLVGTTRGLTNNDSTAGVMVDGVRVSHPDLFLGPRIAVHGIDGILLTGLNMMNQYLDGGENGSGVVLPPAGSPAPAESPVSGSGFVWDVNAPAAAEGNIQVAAPSVMLMGGAERVKVVVGGKKGGKRRRKGHGHGHKRHRKVSGNHHHHHLDDL